MSAALSDCPADHLVSDKSALINIIEKEDQGNGQA